jgi:hypothetical protein
MANLGGTHTQAGTKRALRYWAAYSVADGELHYSAVIQEGDRPLDLPDGTFKFDSAGIPAADVLRFRLIKLIDSTHYGEGKLPDRDPRTCMRWM